MRMGGEPGQRLAPAYLWLTATEAAELRDALNDLIANPNAAWHAHVSSSDFKTEVTVALDRDEF